VILNGNHRYSSEPALAKQEMIVNIKAMRILLFDKNGTLIAEHERAYGSAPSDSTKPARQLPLLCLRHGQSFAEAAALSHARRAGRFGLWATIRSIKRVLAATGPLDAASVVVGAARIAAGDAPIRYDDPVDLSI
jgi:hypothetical protein